MEFKEGESYRLVGIGNISGEDKCSINSENLSSGYVTSEDCYGSSEMIPVDLKRFGPGKIGQKIEFLG